MTTLADSGPGSLRQAILDANAAQGSDSIPINVTGTIYLDSVLPVISGNVTIQGPGPDALSVQLDGANTELADITVGAGAVASIGGLTLSNSVFSADGAVENYGTLVLRDCHIGGTFFVAVDSAGGDLTMEDCIDSGNVFGITVEDSHASISDCTIADNEVQGISSTGNGSQSILDITHCTIARNNGYDNSGGGIDVLGADVTMADCTIAQNTGEGIRADGYFNVATSIRLTNCTISGNYQTSDGGGVAVDSATAILTNCAIVGNQSLDSGGVSVGADFGPASVTLTNCAVSGNSAFQGGAIDLFAGTQGTLNNCVVWGNTSTAGGPQLVSPTPTTFSVGQTDVQGGFTGTGNIAADPQFVRNPSPGADGMWGTADDDYGDLRLQMDSPCIDTGSNASVPSGTTTDLDGNDRIVYGTVDMGSYEWHFPGDANGDRTVDTLDFNALAADFGGSGKHYAQGDFNYDGVVDTLDFNALAAHFGTSLSPASGAATTLSQGPVAAPAAAASMFSSQPVRDDHFMILPTDPA